MKRYILSVLCVLITLSGTAQNTRVIKGKVTDIDGNAISGVILRESEVSKEHTANTDGTFQIGVSPYSKTLTASAEGYLPMELEIDGSYMLFKLKVDKKYAQKAEAERAKHIKAEQEAKVKAEETARAEKAKAEAEAKAKAKAEHLKAAQEAKEKKESERKAINDAHNKIFRNKGFTNTIELSYGYQTGVNGSILYENLGYQNYNTLHPVSLSYQFGYRFNYFLAAGIGTGLTYNCCDINNLHPIWKDSIYNGEAYEAARSLDIPIYINLTSFAGRGKIQPTVSASIGMYTCSCVLLYNFGAGCTFRISRKQNVYILASLKSTPWPDFSRPQDINDSSEPAFNGYKGAITPGIQIGFTL